MGLELIELQEDAEFAALFKVFRAGFTSPGTKLWPIFTADYRPSPALQEAALKETTARLISWHRPDPTSHWLKVVDEDTGEILGGGRWALYTEQNPYDGHGEIEAAWWPEGQPQEMGTIALNRFLATSARLMNKPSIFLNILFTHPDHRRKGVATLIMEWGLAHADRLGLETFVESTNEGKPLYERFGFEVMEAHVLNVDKEVEDEEWKALKGVVLPLKWWSMRRPVKALQK